MTLSCRVSPRTGSVLRSPPDTRTRWRLSTTRSRYPSEPTRVAVVDPLDPVLPDQVSRGRGNELLEQQLRRRDLADIAEEVRGRLTERVVPRGDELHPNSREFPPAGFEERRFGEPNPGAHHRGAAGRPRLEAGPVLVFHREESQVFELAKSCRVGKERERRLAPGENLTAPVHHQSAGSAVTLGLEVVVPGQAG